MRHATCGVGFRARALATIAFLVIGMLAAMRGLLDLI
jgi:hypothetical protein